VQEKGRHRLLDYGAGDGSFAEMILRRGMRRIVCYDPSPTATGIARARFSGDRRVEGTGSTKGLAPGAFDVVTLNAVWMCLRNRRACLAVLREIRRLLSEQGCFYASVTHPCFRTVKFSTFETDFDAGDYLTDGVRFKVRIFDGCRGIEIVDVHWSLGAMSEQLEESGFVITRLFEIPDVKRRGKQTAGSPWLVVESRKRAS